MRKQYEMEKEALMQKHITQLEELKAKLEVVCYILFFHIRKVFNNVNIINSWFHTHPKEKRLEVQKLMDESDSLKKKLENSRRLRAWGARRKQSRAELQPSEEPNNKTPRASAEEPKQSTTPRRPGEEKEEAEEEKQMNAEPDSPPDVFIERPADEASKKAPVEAFALPNREEQGHDKPTHSPRKDDSDVRKEISLSQEDTMHTETPVSQPPEPSLENDLAEDTQAAPTPPPPPPLAEGIPPPPPPFGIPPPPGMGIIPPVVHGPKPSVPMRKLHWKPIPSSVAEYTVWGKLDFVKVDLELPILEKLFHVKKASAPSGIYIYIYTYPSLSSYHLLC